MSIGNNIRAKRLEKRYTLEELAKKVGTSKQTIQRYESGIISNIPSDKIELLAKALDTTPAYLMGWEDNEQKNSDNSELNSAFFRLKKGLEPYELDEEDAEFLLTVFKLHKEKNK